MNELWRPDAARIQSSQLFAFLRESGRLDDPNAPDFAAAHAWSIEQPEEFWAALWQFCAVRGRSGPTPLGAAEDMRNVRFFPEAELNFAENLLEQPDADEAIIALGEDGRLRRWSRQRLREEVAACRQWLESAGIQPGDRVAAVLPNGPEAIVAMLACSAIGAVFASASPDFGVQGLLDRFAQISPRILFGCAGYQYAGKHFDTRAKLLELAAELPSVEMLVLHDSGGQQLPESALSWQDMQAAGAGATPSYRRLPFDHPLFLVFSSGTTGPPKCILHRAGGVLLQHLKEHRLHCDIRAGDRVFFFTTCGWMMWNWLVSALASRATLCLYDGSPFHPGPERLFEFAERERINFFGVSARYLDSVMKSGLRPGRQFKLDGLRSIASTGSPLAPEGFDFVYQQIKNDVHLASISGGTDILACFVCGNPFAPVYRGEIQGPALGMATEVRDLRGRAIVGEAGELVCSRAFPSMPLGFWNDVDGAAFAAAYFEAFPGIWCHGDYAIETPHGGFIILGRSDAVLNPGGVRIGTAEIYRQVQQLDEILESVAVGQQQAADQRVLLFVVLRPGVRFDEALEQRIRQQIRLGASPRHVPARIFPVSDIPRTRSGKLTELAVRELIHGRPVKNIEALANPESLEEFRALLPALTEG
jgi:acetoacetyl-CoA synthetase